MSGGESRLAKEKREGMKQGRSCLREKKRKLRAKRRLRT